MAFLGSSFPHPGQVARFAGQFEGHVVHCGSELALVDHTGRSFAVSFFPLVATGCDLHAEQFIRINPFAAQGKEKIPMMLVAEKAILIVVAIYFLALGAIALIRPKNASSFLLGFADTPLKHYAELVVRLLVGGSLLLVAPTSAHATAMSAFGWILVISTLAMALLPWRLHQRFAQSAVPKALRYLPLIGVTSLLMGGWLLWNVASSSTA